MGWACPRPGLVCLVQGTGWACPCPGLVVLVQCLVQGTGWACPRPGRGNIPTNPAASSGTADYSVNRICYRKPPANNAGHADTPCRSEDIHRGSEWDVAHDAGPPCERFPRATCD